MMDQALRTIRPRGFVLAAVLLLSALLAQPAFALKPIAVSADQDRIEISSLGEFYDSRGDTLQLEMAASSDAVAGRMSVRAVTPGTNPNWVAFALQNTTDKPIERWLTAERYTLFGSGAVWPDLDTRRIEAVTPSLGFVPERVKNDRADVFRITLEPGQTITYVAELSTDRFARIYLWKPIDYELKVRDRQLFNGVLLGLTGLLAIFLTAIFGASHKAIFPAAALVAWCVLALLTVDFGFFHKLFQLRPEDNAIYRAATELAVAASLVIFLNVFLNLSRSPSIVRMLLGLWMAGQLALVGVAVVDPRLASTFARLSFVAIGLIGTLATAVLALKGRDRAMALVPTWLLFLVWVLATSVVITGRLATEIAPPSLTAGLVLIVLLIGFTVTQFAFHAVEPAYGSQLPADQQLSALAVDGAGAAVFQWLSKRNEVKVSPQIESQLGLQSGDLSCKLGDFLKHVHESDRERLRMALASTDGRPGTGIATQFRLRHTDGTMHWFDLQATNLGTAEQRETLFVGLLRDVTDARRVQERLVNDAVRCTLTGLPNRALFLDRLQLLIAHARTDERLRPTVLLIDLDRFKSINSAFGLPVGDGLLLTIARRLQRHVTGSDSLARVGGDQFAILMETDRDAADLAREAERLRRAVRAPVKIAGKEIVITASLGIAIFDDAEQASDLLLDAEIAAFRAKQAGNDRIELFRPEMRSDRTHHATSAEALKRALEKGQIKVLYQPVIYLPTEELAGFKAVPRFEHPDLGTIDPLALETSNEEPVLKARVLAFVLAKAAQDGLRWQRELPRAERALFFSVAIPSTDLLTPALPREVRLVLDQQSMPPGTLKLELPERIVMENPERGGEILEQLRSSGVDLILDGFGAGYSSIPYLHRFAFDTFKIDRMLVEAASGGAGEAATIVRSMVALSLELNRKVAADGVEHPEDAAFLRSIGCAYAQGFYYGDAMPDKDVLQLLRLVRKAERKLESGGLFRLSAKRPKATAAGETAPSADAASAARANGSAKPVAAALGSSKTVVRKPPAVIKPDGVAAPGPRPPAHAPMPDPAPQPMTAAPLPPPLEPVRASAVPPPVYAPMPPPMPPPVAVLVPDPLSSLQAGLEASNGRSSEPPPVQGFQAQPPTPGLDPLSVALAAGVSQPHPAARHPAAPVAVQPVPTQPMAPPAAAVQPPPTQRGRPVKPVDLSKLPPGLAASLARLADGQPSSGQPKGPPRVRRSGAG